MPLDFILGILKQIVDAFPTKAVEVGFGDYNGNDKPDIVVRLILNSGKPIVLGPVDVPFSDVGKVFDAVKGLLPG